MPILTRPSSAAYTSLIYITVGALMDVWSGIWYWYMSRNWAAWSDPYHYICYGFLLTGVVLLVIGFAVGQIGRNARHAELPPPEGLQAAKEQPQLAQQPNPAPPAPPVAPVATPVMTTHTVPVAPAPTGYMGTYVAPPKGRSS